MKSRIERVADCMQAQGLTQAIITDPKSIWYLTGVDVEPMERMFAFLLRTDGSRWSGCSRSCSAPMGSMFSF